MDIRGTGSYVVAPPSIHATGHVYEWIGDPDAKIAPLPAWIEQTLIPPSRDTLVPAMDTEAFAKSKSPQPSLLRMPCGAGPPLDGGGGPEYPKASETRTCSTSAAPLPELACRHDPRDTTRSTNRSRKETDEHKHRSVGIRHAGAKI
jgi:hypothetical protein